jgi:pimeloyl-ACP methyl ester carboxylesterase
VLAIHGLTANSSFFGGVAERLAGRRPLLAPDLRGRGKSDQASPGANWGFDRHAADMAAVLRERIPGKSLVVGHSMGANVAVTLAATYPELVAGLVLVDGGYTAEFGPGVTVNAIADYLLKPIMTRLARTYSSLEDQVATWRRDGHFLGSDWTPWVEAYIARGSRGQPPSVGESADPEAAREDFMQLTEREKINARLQRLSCPVLLLRASSGFLTSLPPGISDAAVAQLRKLLPQVEDQLIAGTTHYTICLSDPGATTTANAIVRWAERVGV